MSLNLTRDRRKRWAASGPATNVWVEEFKKKYGPTNMRLMEKYRDTVYVNNAKMMELPQPAATRRNTSHPPNYDWIGL